MSLIKFCWNNIMGVGNEIYSDLSTFGRVEATFGAIFGTLISIGLIAGGLYFLIKQPQMYEGPTKDNPNAPKTPLPKSSDYMLGGVLTGMGVLILLIVWFGFWMSRKSKLYSAVEGGEGILSILRH